jgi:hypothetical protein
MSLQRRKNSLEIELGVAIVYNMLNYKQIRSISVDIST